MNNRPDFSNYLVHFTSNRAPFSSVSKIPVENFGSLQKRVGFVPVGSSQRSEFDLKEEENSIPEAIGFPPDGLNQVIHAFHLPR